jgi:hypothetical protein
MPGPASADTCADSDADRPAVGFVGGGCTDRPVEGFSSGVAQGTVEARVNHEDGAP